jgi:O-methyltransferase involved in polyketide biosynthesis
MGTPSGATDYVEADIRNTTRILAQAAETLDLSQPVAVILSGIVNFIVDDAEAHSIVRTLVEAVPAGSYLLISHPTMEVNGPAVAESMRQWNESGAAPITARTRDEIAAFFTGLDLLDPGVVTVTAWRPSPEGITDKASEFAGMARKP